MRTLEENHKIIGDKLLKIRRHIHMNPELSFEEKKTSNYIQQLLLEIDVPFTTGWAGTGIVGYLKPYNPKKKTIFLRADLDALPIIEESQHDYKSINVGVMHACGHDVHTTCLLGAIMILKEFETEYNHNICFVFQPGEEKFPGGASILIKEGAIQTMHGDAMVGLHVYPSMLVGNVGFKEGPYMASTDEIYIEVEGKGGHGAMPHLCIDPVVIASHIIIGLQDVMSRKRNPISPSVLSFGKIASNGGATNVIPDKVFLEGTLRAMDEQWRAEANSWIIQIATGIGQTYGAKVVVEIKKGYPMLKNEPLFTQYCSELAKSYLGKEFVYELPIRMTAEDFSYYSQMMNTTFFRIGTKSHSQIYETPVHTATFDVDESCLTIGASLLALFAIKFK